MTNYDCKESKEEVSRQKTTQAWQMITGTVSHA